MNLPNTPLFVKTHDFIFWLMQHTQRFPKAMRHTYTARLETAASTLGQCQEDDTVRIL